MLPPGGCAAAGPPEVQCSNHSYSVGIFLSLESVVLLQPFSGSHPNFVPEVNVHQPRCFQPDVYWGTVKLLFVHSVRLGGGGGNGINE